MQTKHYPVPEESKTTKSNLSTLSEETEHHLRATIKQLKNQINQLTASKEALKLETFNQVSKAFEVQAAVLK